MPRSLTGTSYKGVAELSPGFPVQALSPSTFQASPTRSLFLILFHSIYLLHWWSPPYSPSLNSAFIYPFCKATFIHSHHMSIPSQVCFTSPIQPLHSPFLLLFHSYQTSHTCPHYSLYPILTHNRHPACNSFLLL